MKSRVTRLRFDSSIFGIPCGRLEVSDGIHNGKGLSDLVHSAWSEGMQHLTARIPSECPAVAAVLRSQGFRFVLCSLSLDKAARGQTCGDPSVRVYEGGDDARLREITCGAFTANTRFHLEPAFSNTRVRLLHERWIQNLIEDDSVHVLVHRDGDVITGYVTVQAVERAQEGHIGLIAVDAQYRGQDIGGQLLRSVESAVAPPLRTLSVTTEEMNTRALRLYAHAGYSLRRSWDVLHAYRGSDNGRGALYGRGQS